MRQSIINLNEEVYNFLKINQIEFEENPSFSLFKTYFLPQHKLYLHLIFFQKFQESNLDIHYFQDLSEQQNTKGFRVIHLWEDVWLSKKELAQARILAMIGIFKRLNARHCFVERIDKATSDKFLNDNHLQGSVKAKFKFGLFLKPQYTEKYLANNSFEKQLIAVATYSGGRLMKEGIRAGERSYELIRFASLRGYTVVGGMDKLLKAFESEHKPDDIMTYTDRDWSDGRSYEILGFEKIENTEPQSFLLDIQTFKRHSMKENIENSVKIFNAGSIKFIRKK
jgi:hypothetical protein